MFKVLWVGTVGAVGTCRRLETCGALLRLIYVCTLTQDPKGFCYTLNWCIRNPEAGSAVSRKPEQNPLLTSLSHLNFLGLTKDAGLMTLQKLQDTYIYDMIHVSYCEMGWSSPSCCHQLYFVCLWLCGDQNC